MLACVRCVVTTVTCVVAWYQLSKRRASYPTPEGMSTARHMKPREDERGRELMSPTPLSFRDTHGGAPDYLPVLTYWMHWPWFLNEEPSARFTDCQLPVLQSSFVAATRKGSKL